MTKLNLFVAGPLAFDDVGAAFVETFLGKDGIDGGHHGEVVGTPGGLCTKLFTKNFLNSH